MVKRAFDVCAALCALLMLSPVLICVAFWLKLDSRGPVLFRQQRVGQRGRMFEILKFRTMRADSTTGPQITVGEDPRITQAGALLRRYKLDELPQFINVLRGEMSVVGPRPEVPRYVALYPPEVRDVVLSVRPGITDLASVAFRDESGLLASGDDPEAMYTQSVMPAKLALCVQYVQTRTIWLDLLIIARTALALFKRTNSGKTRLPE